MRDASAGWPAEEFGTPKPVVGVLHLPPLPGSPAGGGWDVERLRDRVERDAAALAGGGADGVLVENFGDAPFRPGDVPPWTVAFMTRLAAAARDVAGLPTGVNVLRNDGVAAVAVAGAVGARFVRVNVYTGARVTDQGVLEGRAHGIQRVRRRVAPEVRVLADVHVKHSSPLGPGRPLRAAVEEAAGRGGADGVIVTGEATGRAPEIGRLREARDAAAVPVFAGSGVTAESAGRYLEASDGLIVGTSVKEEGRTAAPVSEARVRELAEAVRRVRS